MSYCSSNTISYHILVTSQLLLLDIKIWNSAEIQMRQINLGDVIGCESMSVCVYASSSVLTVDRLLRVKDHRFKKLQCRLMFTYRQKFYESLLYLVIDACIRKRDRWCTFRRCGIFMYLMLIAKMIYLLINSLLVFCYRYYDHG